MPAIKLSAAAHGDADFAGSGSSGGRAVPRCQQDPHTPPLELAHNRHCIWPACRQSPAGGMHYWRPAPLLMQECCACCSCGCCSWTADRVDLKALAEINEKKLRYLPPHHARSHKHMPVQLLGSDTVE